MEAKSRIDTVDKTLGGVRLRWSTDGEMEHNLGWVTNSYMHEHLDVGKWLEKDVLQTLKGFVNFFRANHATEPFRDRILWPLRWFSLDKFYSDFWASLLTYEFEKILNVYNEPVNMFYEFSFLERVVPILKE